MNTKIRALLWEELRVGGAIAAVCAFAGVAAQLSLRGAFGTSFSWRMVDSQALILTSAIPLFTALLLVLNTANSGHLGGGFSRRILRLPVNTWNAVLVILLARLVAMLAISSVMVASCWVMFQHGPAARSIFLLAGIYLLCQLSDWARGITPLEPLIVIAFGAAFGAAFVAAWVTYPGSLSALADAIVSQDVITPGFLLAFALSVAATYAASITLVRWTRSGISFSWFSIRPVGDLFPLSRMTRSRPFHSPMAAQVWFESKRLSLSLPTLTLTFYAMIVGVPWVIIHGVPWVVATLYGRSQVGHNSSGESALDQTLLFEIFPYVVLLLMSFMWLLQASRVAKKEHSRPAAFELRLPITAAQNAQARLIVAGANLAPTLLIIALIPILHSLLTGDGFARIVSESLARGETSLHEVLGFFVGIPLAVGLLAWLIMSPTLEAGGWMAVALWGSIAIIASVAPFSDKMGPSWSWLLYAVRPALWILILLPTLGLASGLARTFGKGLISGRSLFTCALLWIIFATAFFPFSLVSSENGVHVLAIASIGLGALPLLPYVGTVVMLSRRATKGPLVRENPEQHLRTRRAGNPITRIACLCVCLVTLAAFAWLRWPAEPAYKALWRAQGLPTNVKEVEAWYPPVEKGRNLADLYLQAEKKRADLDEKWRAGVTREEVAQRREPPYLPELLLAVGNVDVTRTEQIPSDVWHWTKLYWDGVGREVCADLHAAARSGLTESHYPLDFRLWPNVAPSHLQTVRRLADLLCIEAWVAVVERRPEAAADAILDMIPLGDSLKAEALSLSQSTRAAVYGRVCGSLENAMNRVTFSEDCLKRIQKTLTGVFPLRESGMDMDRALIVAQAMTVNTVTQYDLSGILFWYDSIETKEILSFVDEAFGPLTQLLNIGGISRLALINQFSRCRDRLRNLVLQGNVTEVDPSEDLWTRNPFLWIAFAGTGAPYVEYSYGRELMTRTGLDLALTAVAVERFRLAHGRLPRQLNELVPTLLDRIPGDPWNEGGPLSYRIKDDGEYVVYSYGRNRQDDHGEAADPQRRWDVLDITFTVAPPEFRERPQVASESSSIPEK